MYGLPQLAGKEHKEMVLNGYLCRSFPKVEILHRILTEGVFMPDRERHSI
jgi:hypothetical protein